MSYLCRQRNRRRRTRKAKLMAHFIIADNQPLTSIGLEVIIHRRGFNTSVHAADSASLMNRLKERSDSIVLLDYTLFDYRDAESLLVVSERFPSARWILLSDELTLPFLKKVVYRSHSFSVVFKDATGDDVEEAFRQAAKGKRFLCTRAAEMLLIKNEEANPAKLTATEIEILRGIAQGKTTKEIAAERISSVYTVGTHRKNIFRKLNVNTAHEAVKYALRAGLVDPGDFYI